jgi:hypothetical protein
MDRKRLQGGTIKSAGYDEARRVLQVELANGQLLDYAGVGREIARRLMESQSPQSYYRDNIENEFTARPAGRVRPDGPPSGDPFG